MFGDAEFDGNFNKEGTDGSGTWSRDLKYNWSRDDSAFGNVVAAFTTGGGFDGRLNLKDGVATVHGVRGEWIQVVYKMNDNEWWKVHYAGNPGEEGDKTVEFMYKWLKVIDKDGNPTEHWDNYKEWSHAPLPNDACCGLHFIPCWGCCLSGNEMLENMTYPSPKQVVNLRIEGRDDSTIKKTD